MARILITGTSKGIGYDIALTLARAGHDVLATMRNPSASDLGDVASKESLQIDIEQMDVDSDVSVEKVMSQCAENIDVLVNNAGIATLNAIEDEDVAAFESVMNTNYLGVVRCTKAVLPYMRKRGAGTIINISSVGGRVAATPFASYAASKHALEAFSEVLSQEMKQFGVRVAIIEPGITATPLATTELPKYDPETAYPGGRRITAIYKNAGQVSAPPSLVADRVRYLIESDDETLRHPVGPDALPYLGWRESLSDESFRDVLAAPTDEEFAARYLQ